MMTIQPQVAPTPLIRSLTQSRSLESPDLSAELNIKNFLSKAYESEKNTTPDILILFLVLLFSTGIGIALFGTMLLSMNGMSLTL